MKETTTWWWVRHAPVPGAETGRIYGQMDMDCDVSAAEDFRWLAARLPEDAVVFVSPLKRTHQTYEAIIAGSCQAPVPSIEADLAEQNFGAWQGKIWDEMKAADPVAYDEFWCDPLRLSPPGGESFENQMKRVRGAIERLNKRHAGRNIVSISHGGTIRAALATALDLSPDATMSFAVDNLSLTRLSYAHDSALRPRGSAWRIDCVNLLNR